MPHGPRGVHLLALPEIKALAETLLIEYLKAVVITGRNSGQPFPDSMDVSSRPLHRDGQSMSIRDRLAVANAAAPNVADEGRVERAVPAQVTLPTNLSGNNAQLADDELRKLGIVTISYTSQDTTGKVVPPLANWTVTKVEPAPGTVVHPPLETAQQHGLLQEPRRSAGRRCGSDQARRTWLPA